MKYLRETRKVAHGGLCAHQHEAYNTDAPNSQFAFCSPPMTNRRGNEHFVAKRYAEAVQCYSQAIAKNASNHVLFGNRRSVSASLSTLKSTKNHCCAWNLNEFRVTHPDLYCAMYLHYNTTPHYLAVKIPSVFFFFHPALVWFQLFLSLHP